MEEVFKGMKSKIAGNYKLAADVLKENGGACISWNKLIQIKKIYHWGAFSKCYEVMNSESSCRRIIGWPDADLYNTHDPSRTRHEFLLGAYQYTSLGICHSVGMLNTLLWQALGAGALTY